MSKLDLRKRLGPLYDARSEPALVEVPAMSYLMIDGSGDPNVEGYQQATEALFALSYALKFAIKKSGGPDYGVLPLEGLWRVDDLAALDLQHRENWRWTSMIMQPDQVTAELVERTREEVRKKKQLPSLDRLRFETFEEGLAAQVLHIGPYADERPTIERLHRFVEDNGYELRDKHHEIYLGDPRRAVPDRLRTILRHPVRKRQ
mgnify:FL=1|jgi:hypothetical protein